MLGVVLIFYFYYIRLVICVLFEDSFLYGFVVLLFVEGLFLYFLLILLK